MRFVQGGLMRIDISFNNGSQIVNKSLTAIQAAPVLGAFSLQLQEDSEYTVLTQDLFVHYLDDTFTLVYFCMSRGEVKVDLGWVLSREQFPEIYLVESVANRIREVSPDLLLDYADHFQCPDHNLNRRRLQSFYNYGMDKWW